MKNSNDIGNQTRDLPPCSVVSQPTAPTRAPDMCVCVCVCVCVYIYIYIYIYTHTHTHTHTHVFHNIETLVGSRNKKTGTTVNATCQGNLYMSDILDTHTIGSLALVLTDSKSVKD